MGTFRPKAPVRMRVTRLTECGVPWWDDECTYYVRNCTVSATWADQIEDPQEYLLRCDDDELQFFDRSKPVYKFAEVTLTINDNDPVLKNLIIGTDIETDAQTMDAVGYRMNAETFGKVDFAFEFWTKLASGPGTPACPDGLPRWAYALWPFGTNGRFSATPTLGNNTDAVALMWDARLGGAWDDGPFDVVRDAGGNPSPLLDPMQPSQPYLLRETTVPPPEVTDGCVGLSSPGSP